MNLDHTIVPAADNKEAAALFARIFDLTTSEAAQFVQVRVNDTLTLDFYTMEDFSWHHYAFHVGEAEFDDILARVQAEGIPFGSGPQHTDNGEIGSPFQGGRNVYFTSPDAHIYEFMTVPETGASR